MAVSVSEGWADDVEVFGIVREIRKAAEAEDNDLVVMLKLEMIEKVLGEDGYAALMDELRGEDGRCRVTSVISWFDAQTGPQAKN